MLTVKNIKILNKLRNHDIGELAQVEDTGLTYEYTENGWTKYNAPSVEMSLYDINKQYYFSKPDMTVEDAKAAVKDYCDNHPARYHMLLNNEKRYYTVFETGCEDGNDTFFNELIETMHWLLHNKVDSVKSVEWNEETQMLELWCKIEDTCTMYALFNYEFGVIRCQ